MSVIVDLTYGTGAMARELGIEPTVKNVLTSGGFDFRKIPLPSESVDLVLFDPPHKFMRPSLLKEGGVWGAFVKHYGAFDSYRDMLSDIHQAFLEIERVIHVGGVCIFKWCDTDCMHSRIVREIPESFAVDFKRREASRQRKSLTLYWYLTREW